VTLVRSRLVRSALSLYAIQASSWLLPLATIFFLARRLGPEHWGLLVFMQGAAAYVIFLVSYGFTYSATREVARNRGDPDRLADVLAGVLGAKVSLALLSVLIVIPAGFLVPAIHRSQGLLWPTMLWALAWAFSASWYYQGRERIEVAAVCEASARVLSLVGILALVRFPGDTWKVLVIQGGLMFAAVLVEMGLAYREVRFRMPTPRLVWQSLRWGWGTFLLGGALSLYTIGNGFILGLFASSTVVAYYMGAERISKNFATLLSPITQAIFPRTSHLAVHERGEAARLTRTSLFLMGGAGCVIGVLVFLGAPLLVRLVLGPGYEPAVVVLRILACLPPLIVASNVLAVQWMLALGLERLVNRLMFAAGVLNILLAVVLVPRYMHVGMAIAVVTAEALVTFGLYSIVRIKHIDPLAIARLREQAGSVRVSA
jgi:PST family polysaccharide transporter